MPIYKNSKVEWVCDLCATRVEFWSKDGEPQDWVKGCRVPDFVYDATLVRTKLEVICPVCARHLAAAVASCVSKANRQPWLGVERYAALRDNPKSYTFRQKRKNRFVSES